MCCIYKSYNRYVIFNRVILLCVCLFIPLVVFLEEQKFLILMKSIFLFYRLWFLVIAKKGFSGNSAGKESARNGGEKPQFDFWVGKMRWRRGRLPTPVFLGFPVARLVKNPSAVLDPWVGKIPWCCAMEESMATHSSILAWRIPRDGGAWRATVNGVTKCQTRLSRSTAQEIFAWPRSQSFSPGYF